MLIYDENHVKIGTSGYERVQEVQGGRRQIQSHRRGAQGIRAVQIIKKYGHKSGKCTNDEYPKGNTKNNKRVKLQSPQAPNQK